MNTPTPIDNLVKGQKYQYVLSNGRVMDGIFVKKHENGRIMMKAKSEEPNVLADSVSPNATFYRLEKFRSSRKNRKNRKNTRKNRKN